MMTFDSRFKRITELSIDLACRGSLKLALLLLCLVPTAAFAQAPPWVRAIGAAGNGASQANAIKVDADKNQYVTGQFNTTAEFSGSTLVSAG